MYNIQKLKYIIVYFVNRNKVHLSVQYPYKVKQTNTKNQPTQSNNHEQKGQVNNMTIKEVKRIDTNKVRAMCIKNNWYTAGTTKDYSNMFRMCETDNVTPLNLYEIAKDIYEHTNIDTAKTGCNREYSDNENILNMMIYVNDCSYVFYEMSE